MNLAKSTGDLATALIMGAPTGKGNSVKEKKPKAAKPKKIKGIPREMTTLTGNPLDPTPSTTTEAKAMATEKALKHPDQFEEIVKFLSSKKMSAKELLTAGISKTAWNYFLGKFYSKDGKAVGGFRDMTLNYERVGRGYVYWLA